MENLGGNQPARIQGSGGPPRRPPPEFSAEGSTRARPTPPPKPHVKEAMTMQRERSGANRLQKPPNPRRSSLSDSQITQIQQKLDANTHLRQRLAPKEQSDIGNRATQKLTAQQMNAAVERRTSSETGGLHLSDDNKAALQKGISSLSSAITTSLYKMLTGPKEFSPEDRARAGLPEDPSQVGKALLAIIAKGPDDPAFQQLRQVCVEKQAGENLDALADFHQCQQMIEDGSIDRQTLDSLAEKVGVGPNTQSPDYGKYNVNNRQFKRAFENAFPDAVASASTQKTSKPMGLFGDDSVEDSFGGAQGFQDDESSVDEFDGARGGALDDDLMAALNREPEKTTKGEGISPQQATAPQRSSRSGRSVFKRIGGAFKKAVNAVAQVTTERVSPREQEAITLVGQAGGLLKQAAPPIKMLNQIRDDLQAFASKNPNVDTEAVQYHLQQLEVKIVQGATEAEARHGEECDVKVGVEGAAQYFQFVNESCLRISDPSAKQGSAEFRLGQGLEDSWRSIDKMVVERDGQEVFNGARQIASVADRTDRDAARMGGVKILLESIVTQSGVDQTESLLQSIGDAPGQGSQEEAKQLGAALAQGLGGTANPEELGRRLMLTRQAISNNAFRAAVPAQYRMGGTDPLFVNLEKKPDKELRLNLRSDGTAQFTISQPVKFYNREEHATSDTDHPASPIGEAQLQTIISFDANMQVTAVNFKMN